MNIFERVIRGIVSLPKAIIEPLFGTPSTAPQQQQIAKQEDVLAKQEAEQSRERADLAERAMAAQRARRRGGLRMLLSAERPDELGVQPNKLGGGT